MKLFLSVLATVYLIALPALAAPITGAARVIDGDTIEVEGHRIRLHGIDAPEIDQTCINPNGQTWECGAWVRSQLIAEIEGRNVNCEPLDIDRYGRVVAQCSFSNVDIGAKLVESGFAHAYLRYSQAYASHEARARADHRGLWAGEMQEPAAYRRAGTQGTEAPDPSCAIKGNISNNGRIFHQPGERSYARTGINLDRGERWFCSVDQALSAGWRAARG